MIQCINSFSQIAIKSKTLVVLDIDDTILNMPSIKKGWWTNTFDKYYGLYQDYDKAEQMSLIEWENLIINDKAQLLDPDNFETFLKKIREQNSDLILLTARNDKFKELTKKHLSECDINIHPYRIYHDRNKGEKLLDLVTNVFVNMSQIIFVDDLESNLDDVQNSFSGTQFVIKLYHINHH